MRVLGASGYRAEGMQEIIASQGTWEMIVERGQQDMMSEYERFPRLFQNFESIPGLTWPSVTFAGEMSIWLGTREVRIRQIGRGHTAGGSGGAGDLFAESAKNVVSTKRRFLNTSGAMC